MQFSTKTSLKNATRVPFCNKTNVGNGLDVPSHVFNALGCFSSSDIEVAHFDCTSISSSAAPSGISSHVGESECHVKIDFGALVASLSPSPSLSFGHYFGSQLSSSTSFDDEWEEEVSAVIEIYHDNPQLAHTMEVLSLPSCDFAAPQLVCDVEVTNQCPIPSFDHLFSSSVFDNEPDNGDSEDVDYETSASVVEIYHEDCQLARQVEVLSRTSHDFVMPLAAVVENTLVNTSEYPIPLFGHFFSSSVYDEELDNEDFEDVDYETAASVVEIYHEDRHLARQVELVPRTSHDFVSPFAVVVENTLVVNTSGTLRLMPEEGKHTTGFRMVRGWHTQPTLVSEPDVDNEYPTQPESSSKTSLHNTSTPVSKSIWGSFVHHLTAVFSRSRKSRGLPSGRPGLGSHKLSTSSSITVIDDGDVEISLKQRMSSSGP